MVKQSFPFSYLQISVVSNDGASHAVQVYTDISAEWISGQCPARTRRLSTSSHLFAGDNSKPATWTTTSSGLVWTHQISLQHPQLYTEISDHTECERTEKLAVRREVEVDFGVAFNRWRRVLLNV